MCLTLLSSCSHLLPNLGGGGLYSQNVPLLTGAKGGDGLLGASPSLLPPTPGGSLTSGLGGASLMGSGQGGLLGSAPDMQGYSEDSGNAPGSVLDILPSLEVGVEACWEGEEDLAQEC